VVWVVETLNAIVDAEVQTLPADMRAQLSRISLMIEEFGLERMREPHVKHLRGPLWEMRMRGRDGISRALYVAARGRRVIIVRVFIKKSQTTPGREIDLALSRAKEAIG
jgi:phage-related protein